MKKAIILLLLLTACTQVQEYTSGCTWWAQENCDTTCTTDKDCKQSKCGNCINIHETCKTTKWTELGTETVEPSLVEVSCKCIHNQCVPAG